MFVVANTTTPTPMTVSKEASVCLPEIDARAVSGSCFEPVAAAPGPTDEAHVVAPLVAC